ncbi:hypothetical protein DIE07_03585 [Burkholderia sp. Bp9002]|nr:hypothetical protein DIE07_03585 [Burkholderia sp. Bp9002]
MSNSTTNLDLPTATSASKEAILNALFDAASPASLWGRQASACAGLVWGYYGGCFCPQGGSPQLIANGTVTLVANATNYVYADPTSGAVSLNQTGFPAGKIPLYSVVVPNGGVTASSYLDYRSYQPSAIGAAVQSIANEGSSGIGLYDATNSTAILAKFKTLLQSGGVSLAVGSTAITVSLTSGGGTVTGGSNEGAGVGVFDSTNSTSSNLAMKTLVAGSNIRLADYGTSGIVVDVAGGPPDVLQSGALVVPVATTLNFQGFSVTNPSGSTAAVTRYPDNGSLDTIPSLASFTQVNAAGAGMSVSQQPWGITGVAAAGVGQWGLLTKSVPSAPYQVVARLRAVPLNTNNGGFGVCLYDSSSGKIKTFVVSWQSSLGFYVQNFTNVSTWSNNPLSGLPCSRMPTWMRIRDDNTNWYYEVSGDGATWVTLYQEAHNSFLTPNSVGVGAVSGSTYSLGFAVSSFYAGT